MFDGHSYGTFRFDEDTKCEGMTVSEGGSGDNVESSSLNCSTRPLAGQASDVASIISDSSFDSAQAGVKRLEAISSTWSKSGLVVAYLG